jgi:putative hemolysin
MKFFSSFLFFCLLTSSSWGSEQNKILKTPEGDFILYAKNNFWVSKNCLEKKCDALKSHSPKESKADAGKWIGNPSSAFCEVSGGKYIIGKLPSGDEDGLCLLKDKSYILSWDYYYRNKAKK